MRRKTDEEEDACKRAEEELERLRKEETAYRVCIVHMHARKHTMHTCIHAYTQAYMHAHTHSFMHVCPHECTHRYMCTYTQTCAHAQIHM